MAKRTPSGDTSKDATAPATANDLRKLLVRAEKGDKTTLPALRAVLQKETAVAMLGGDLAGLARENLVSRLAGGNLVLRESVLQKFRLLQAEIAGAEPTPVERLLADQVVLCWARLHDLELRLNQDERDFSLAQVESMERRIDRAHRRYLGSIKMLALVRRMAHARAGGPAQSRRETNRRGRVVTEPPPEPAWLPVPVRPAGALDASTAATRLLSAFLSGRKAETIRAYKKDLEDFARFCQADNPEDAAGRLLSQGAAPPTSWPCSTRPT